jgi:3-oxoacyl-[acyl-carrier protein] reductase
MPQADAMAIRSTRALITGASRGIGAACALALARVGHPVIINYLRDHASAEAVKARIEGDGGSAQLAPFDVADASATASAIGKLLEDERPIGVLVNNAGIVRDNAFPAMPGSDWSAVTRTTLDGFFNVTQPLVMPMVRLRWGRIISMASISGTLGNRGQTNYAAAKAGLIGATRSLAMELAKRNITVNAVAPGLIETDMTRGAAPDEVKKLIPMRRMGRPEEVAALVRFLASEDAAYITGQAITISGGLG